MPRVQSQDNNISVSVTGSASAGSVRATNSQAEYWADKSKAWAISDELVDNTDYSSKFYANQSKEAYENLADDIGDLTEESLATIEDAKNNAINEIYTQISDIPLAYGAWSELPMGENWLKVDSDGKTVLKTDYPKLWVLLKNILDGSLSCSEIGVISATEYDEIVSGATEEDLPFILDKLAYYYVLDLANETIQIPKLVDPRRLIGCKRAVVAADANNAGGCYLIYNNGEYEEYSFIARLEKATRTVNGQSVAYHKVTQWDDPTTEFTLTPVSEHSWTKIYTGGSADFTNKLRNAKGNTYINYAFKVDPEGEVDIGNIKAQSGYPNYEISNRDTEGFDFSIRVYDDRYTYTGDIIGEKLEDCIPDGETEAFLISEVYGTVHVPNIADYNGEYRLYIKVA